MMGHSGLVKTDRNYFKAHVLELAEEYLNAVKDLTISDAERLRVEKIKLQKVNKENEQKFQDFEKDLQEVKKNMQRVHDFASFKYEDDPKKQMEKHLRLCNLVL